MHHTGPELCCEVASGYAIILRSCGVLLDLDAYLEDPSMPGIAISDFINASHEDFVVIKDIVLAKRRTQEVTDG